MNNTELRKILERHLHWIREDCDGWEDMHADLTGADLTRANLIRANLTGANLTGANLTGADLTGADLPGADLPGADLTSANLYGADLPGADLPGANLTGANMYGADLTSANLYGANLTGANMYGADLTSANLTDAKIETSLINKFFPICCPEYGEFIAWKKASNHIVKLQIPEDAKRSSAFGRKCRASKAVCLEIQDKDGANSGMIEISSDHDSDFIYRVGEIIEVADFDDDRTHECAPGIHFFITRQEAVNY